MRLLVRRRPVGRDLRFALATIKLVSELERVSELAVNVVHRRRALAERPLPREIEELARAATTELATAIEALRTGDAGRARTLQIRESPSNVENREALRRLHALAVEQPRRFADVLALTAVCRYLERIGDHAAGIARRVVYVAEGVTLPHLDENDQP